MSDLVVPSNKVIAHKETLFRVIKHEYIDITANDFKLKTSFTLIDPSHRVSFYRPYIIGLECLSKQKFDVDFRNSKNIVSSIIDNLGDNAKVNDALNVGRKELIKQAKFRWKEDVIFCEFSLETFTKNGFTTQGQPNKNNISHAIVDFSVLSSKTQSRKAEKYISENDTLIYSSNTSLINHLNVTVVHV